MVRKELNIEDSELMQTSIRPDTARCGREGSDCRSNLFPFRLERVNPYDSFILAKLCFNGIQVDRFVWQIHFHMILLATIYALVLAFGVQYQFVGQNNIQSDTVHGCLCVKCGAWR